jgi:poly-beta-1,6-N-acetyl-D-glucosamine synthase
MIERFAAELYAWSQIAWNSISLFESVDWIILIAPAVVFLEIPRYYLPLVWAVLMRLLGKDKPAKKHDATWLNRQPFVSIVVAGRNEEHAIGACVRSLLEQDYPNFEILVIDDQSDDRTYQEIVPFTQDPRVRLVRNNSRRGRSGRPSASNLGLRLSRGELLVSLDADTTFDHQLVSRLIAPFADAKVGVVAGNVLIRNWRDSVIAQLQALEYAIAIDINKRWTDARNATLQASGAVGAFRKQALIDIGGWEQQLGEDTDLSLRMIKAGWQLRFAPDAVARTDCPTTFAAVARQRFRWDRGGIRAFFKKHHRLLKPSIAGFWFALELATEFLFAVVATLIYPIYLGWLFWQGAAVASFLLVMIFGVYVALSLASLGAVALATPRIERPRALILAAILNPFYKEALRWVRLRATIYEILRIRYEDPFLPDSAWIYAKRY